MTWLLNGRASPSGLTRRPLGCESNQSAHATAVFRGLLLLAFGRSGLRSLALLGRPSLRAARVHRQFRAQSLRVGAGGTNTRPDELWEAVIAKAATIAAMASIMRSSRKVVPEGLSSR